MHSCSFLFHVIIKLKNKATIKIKGIRPNRDHISLWARSISQLVEAPQMVACCLITSLEDGWQVSIGGPSIINIVEHVLNCKSSKLCTHCEDENTQQNNTLLYIEKGYQMHRIM